jgi:CheY-like chemotaxis protein
MMGIPAAKPKPVAIWRHSHAEWRRLQGAMLRLESSAVSVPRVLIVDDDPATRLLYALNLQLEGLVVLEAADGRSGLARAREERPDLVLTDVMMPGLDGFQLAEALRGDKRTRRIPFIFLSGETTAGHEARARELGALAYVTKPFDVHALAVLVASVLVGSGDGVRPAAPVGDDTAPLTDSAA